MKVEIKGLSKTLFADLQDGDVFKYAGGIYMKVESLLSGGDVLVNGVFICLADEVIKESQVNGERQGFFTVRIRPNNLVEKFDSATLVLE